MDRLSNAGHVVVEIFDERGNQVKTAHVEIGDRAFNADSKGQILIPYREASKLEPVTLVDGAFAARQSLLLRNEGYALRAGFIIDRQSLVAGTQTTVLIRTRLECNQVPVG